MQTIQEILNFSVGKLTVGNIIFAIAIFIVCHMVIKALMGPINKLLDKLSFDKTLRTFLQAAIRVIRCRVHRSRKRWHSHFLPAGCFRYVWFGCFPVRTGRALQSG